MRVKIDVDIHSTAAVVIGTIGFLLITLVTLGQVPEEWARLGFALLFIGGTIWLHGQINRVVQRMCSREDAAFNFGKLAAVKDRQHG